MHCELMCTNVVDKTITGHALSNRVHSWVDLC